MSKRVLLTGATGFVGHAITPALRKAGWMVRATSREAHASETGVEWVQVELGDEDAVREALLGCDAALYLVHEMGGGGDFAKRERESAERFGRAAADAGVQRIVYLGGIEPAGDPSEHLRSRLEVGEILRGGKVPTVELRASMIIGHGSISWLIVRDLAARLPVMVLPSWLRSKTEPVAVHDVVVALVKALEVELPDDQSAWFDIPGPEVLTGRQILQRTARALGRPTPKIIEVPFLTPQLSSFWLRFVTGADWKVAREIVLGLAHDVVSRGNAFWPIVSEGRAAASLIGFDEAAARAIREQQTREPVKGLWRGVERLLGVSTRPSPRGATAS